MDRNSIIGLVLIGVILMIFTYLNKPSEEQIAESKRIQDSITEVQKEIAIQQAAKENKTINSIDQKVDQAIDTATQNKNLLDLYGVFAKAANGEEKFYTIENELIKLNISSKGGKPYSVELKNYFRHDSSRVKLFEGDSVALGFNFFALNRSISTNQLFFTPLDSITSVVLEESDSTAQFRIAIQLDENRSIQYTYQLYKESYRVGFKVEFIGLNQIISQNTSILDLDWNVYALSNEKGWKNEYQYTGLYFKYLQDEVDNLNETSNDEEKMSIPTKVKWIAYKQQFFSSVLLADEYFTNAQVKQSPMPENSVYVKHFYSQLGLPFNSQKDQNVYQLSFYFGPNHFQTLKAEGHDLHELVFIGRWIIKWINRYVIIPIFNFLNNYILNYGIIILLLTIIIKLALFPLTYKSYLSMAKMRVLKPQIDEINEKIPADKPLERQQATMNLYRKVGVNPLGGCLPILLQMPILIAMFRFFPTSIELRQEGFLWADDLSTFDAIVSWDTYIPLITPYFGNHISLFNILMTITTVITIHMSNKLQTSAQTLPGMKTISYLMPIMFMFFLNSFSSGLTYYYFLANLITILQNEIFRRSINEEKLLAKLNENKKKPVKKSSFQERLEKMAKERGYKMPKR